MSILFGRFLVALFTFGWLYHHSFFYRSEDGENPNVDDLEVGVFPVHYDDLKLELAWTIVPFMLIVYLTYISWAPLDNVWSSPNDGGYFGMNAITILLNTKRTVRTYTSTMMMD